MERAPKRYAFHAVLSAHTRAHAASGLIIVGPGVSCVPRSLLHLTKLFTYQKEYIMKIIIYILVGFLCSGASAGWFEITSEDEVSVSVHYTGKVERYDPVLWDIIVSKAGDRTILLTIDSPGGDAYAGLRLYWALEAHPRLVTIAGGDVGAWSAAAIMWLAGDHKLIDPHGAVWFHAAYCTWDPEPPVEIGCDTSDFQKHLVRVFDNAGFIGASFNAWLNLVQKTYGTDGWIGITNDGWEMRDTTDWWFKPFNKEWIIR